ncbi:hypothetical protein LTR29_006534 [Friedmanniomyces endolithicus]|nr:hypothetical protein LTR29_006534 [Friedmanniomyces endolithicus]
MNAAEALLELGQPVHHTQESRTSASQALLALDQPVHHAPQRLSSTANVSSLPTHHHDANNSSHAAAPLPLYNPPIPNTSRSLEHQAAEAVLALTPTPPRSHSFNQEDHRAAEALLALSREDSQAAGALLAANPTRPRPNPCNPAGFQAAEGLSASEPGNTAESVDAEDGQVRARRVEVVVERYVEVRQAEASERRDSANDGALAGERVGARGSEGEGNQQEERARDERSLWSE